MRAADLSPEPRELHEQFGELRAKYRSLRIECKDLRAENSKLHEENDTLRAENERLLEETKDLKRKLEEAQRAGRRQAAPFRRRKRVDNPKKPGQKPKHAAAHRPVPEHVDDDVDVPLVQCPYCGGEVDEHGTHEQYQVDIPPVNPHVTKFTNHYGRCTRCGRPVHSRHPKQTSTATGAAAVQFGPQVLTMGVELKEHVGIPYRKVAGIFLQLFHLEVSAGALARANQRIAKRCEPSYEALVLYLRESDVVHADETGWYIAGAPKKAWLWVFATPEGVTMYAIRLSRGGDVPLEILSETFEGTMVVDGWAVYSSLGFPLAQCNAHLLRRAAELCEVQQGEAAEFPQQVKDLLKGAILLGRARELTLELWNERYWERAVRDVERQLAELLEPLPEDPDNRRFRNHLVAHQSEILAFLHDPAIAPTNSLAEREIRPAVIMRKVSAGNRTVAGAHSHEILASLTRTAERAGVRFPDILPALLRSPGPVVLTPERLGLPAHPRPPAPRSNDASAPSAPAVRHQSRRAHRVARAHPATAPP